MGHLIRVWVDFAVLMLKFLLKIGLNIFKFDIMTYKFEKLNFYPLVYVALLQTYKRITLNNYKLYNKKHTKNR